MQAEDAEGRLHAVGRMDSKEGTNIIIVQFYLTAESQAGNPAGLQRSAHNHLRHLTHGKVKDGSKCCYLGSPAGIGWREPASLSLLQHQHSSLWDESRAGSGIRSLQPGA